MRSCAYRLCGSEKNATISRYMVEEQYFYLDQKLEEHEICTTVPTGFAEVKML